MVKRKPPKSWNPKPRTVDEAVIAQIHRIRPNLKKSCPISFYLYFPTEEAAAKSAMELRNKGFITEVNSSIGKLKWLCLATKDMIPETKLLTKLRGEMMDIVLKYDGEYDGWEAEISND